MKLLVISLLALFTCGCATTFVPVSWGFGEKVHRLSRSDPTLTALFDRYDPQRKTVRVAGESFDEVMMPSEVKYHLGAYRPDTKLIYRNLYQEYSDRELRDLLLHELAHHVWFGFMSQAQREEWRAHLAMNTSPLQDLVRQVYGRPADFASEDFAFTVEFARPVDIEELARLQIISARERDAILTERFLVQHSDTRGNAGRFAAGPELSKTLPQPTNKGTDTGK